MTGYQEIVSDPSYHGQILVMTYPLIGNQGINMDDFKSTKPHILGLVVKELCDTPSHYKSETTLYDYIKSHQIPFITDIDTRELTKVIRDYGTMRATISEVEISTAMIVKKIQSFNLPKDYVSKVSTNEPYTLNGNGKRVVLIDLGVKQGIINELVKKDFDLTVIPYNSTLNDVIQYSPDKVIVSDGPGNPKDVKETIHLLKELIGRVPIFGICLGHQLLALACGADTRKMKFGHRGSNYPVKDIRTNKTFITSQNHSYTVDEITLIGTELEAIQVALNDKTIEAIIHKKYPIVSVQYYPVGSSGTEEINRLFVEFLNQERRGEHGFM